MSRRSDKEAKRSSEPKPVAYNSKRDCLTLAPPAPGERANLVTVSHQCGPDTMTMLDILGVPSEHAAAVIITSDVTPNSACNWGPSPGGACTQVLFFDTRRPAADLVSLVWTAMTLNHTMTNAGLPLFVRKTPRSAKAAPSCQCGAERCPGDVTRLEELRRTGIPPSISRRCDPEHIFTRANTCRLTSDTIDYALHETNLGRIRAGQPALGATRWTKQTSSSDEQAPTGVIQLPTYEPGAVKWQLYDAHTGMPVLADTPMPGSDASLLYSKPLMANGPVRVTTIDSAVVLQHFAQSKHTLALCAGDIDTMIEDLLPLDLSFDEMLFGIYNEVMTTNCQRENSFSDSDSDTDEPSAARDAHEASLEKEERDKVDAYLEKGDFFAVLPDTHPRVRAGRAFLERLAQTTDAKRHRYGCNCLIEHLVRQHCTKQIALVVTPLPIATVYADAGDTVLAVESELMRLMAASTWAVHAQMSAVLDASDKQIAKPPERLDLFAQPDDPNHPDNILDESPALRSIYQLSFGRYASVRRVNGLPQFQPEGRLQRKRWFGTVVKGTLPRDIPRIFGDVLNPGVSISDDYGALLADLIRAFGAPAQTRNVVGVAVHCGLFKDTQAWFKYQGWLTPALYHSLKVAAMMPDVIEHYARRAYAEPDSVPLTRTYPERALIAELRTESNWRLAIARVMALCPTATTWFEYLGVLLYSVSAIALPVLMLRLDAWRTQTAANERQEAQRARAAAVEQARKAALIVRQEKAAAAAANKKKRSADEAAAARLKAAEEAEKEDSAEEEGEAEVAGAQPTVKSAYTATTSPDSSSVRQLSLSEFMSTHASVDLFETHGLDNK